MAWFSGNVVFLAVEHALEGENLLAAFVVLVGSDAYVHALPAKRGNDARRADDGEFQPDNVEALFSLRESAGALEVAVDWLGAEGASRPDRIVLQLRFLATGTEQRVDALRNGELINDPKPCSVALSAGNLSGHAAIGKAS